MLAAFNGHDSLVNLLVQRAANVDARNIVRSFAAVFTARRCASAVHAMALCLCLSVC